MAALRQLAAAAALADRATPEMTARQYCEQQAQALGVTLEQFADAVLEVELAAFQEELRDDDNHETKMENLCPLVSPLAKDLGFF